MPTWFDTKNFRNALSYALDESMRHEQVIDWLLRAEMYLTHVLPCDRALCEKEFVATCAIIEKRRTVVQVYEE